MKVARTLSSVGSGVKKSPCLLLLCLWCTSSAPADAQAPSGVGNDAIATDAAVNEQSLSLGGVEVVVWSDRSESGTPQPVVVFSHGIGLCPTQTRFLTRALASAGYLVVAPEHADSSCSDLNPSLPDPTRMALKPALMWTDRDYSDRADDVRNVVAALKSDTRFRERADMTRLALAGHSLGGYTVLGLGGAWPTWTLPGVKAIVALSPYSAPFRAKQGLRKLHAPVMYQGGTLDL